MKAIYRILSVLSLGLALCSCEDFLQKPDTTGTVDQDAVYSSEKNAFSALMACYKNSLRQGLPGGWGFSHNVMGSISGEIGRGYSWHGSYTASNQGLSPNGFDNGDAGADVYAHNWMIIRECFLVVENIDKVPDMSEQDKAYIKGEATALIAYRYMGMFYRYGGVPKVTHTFNASDDLSMPRMSLQETLEYTLGLLDTAYDLVPEKWDAANTGRIHKGAVLAMKARLLMFAARPLFNSATPYLDNGNLNNLICFGAYDKERWKQAIDANLAVLDWANRNGVRLINTGGMGEGVANPNAFDDYATAASQPGSDEIILAYKFNDIKHEFSSYDMFVVYCNTSPNVPSYRYDTDANGVLTNLIENYYANDGTDIDWPKIGENAPRSGADYRANYNKLEARALADIKWGGYDAKNNQGVTSWSNQGWNRGGYNADPDALSSFPNAVSDMRGCGEYTKFYYKAGTRVWCEIPLFRLAETYLYLAEAYNEYGDKDNALKYLNAVHNRAGLPKLTDSDQDKLRERIQREVYIEFFLENHRYFDSKHWKRADLSTNICGGKMRMLQFKVKTGSYWPYAASTVESYWDAEAYNFFWKDAMYLEPFPQEEINKGYTTQNPGY